MLAEMIHLHVHGEHSALDGLDSPETIAKRAAFLGMKACGLTDHGTMGGIPEFYWSCKKEGIWPVMGCEFYFAPDFAASVARHRTSNFHVVILAKNLAGLETLMELCSVGHQQFYQKPLIDRAAIAAIDRSNLVCLSGCAGSIISRKAMGTERGDVDKEVRWWKRMFPNFFIELMEHNTEFDRELNTKLVALAIKHDIPWVVTNDPHFALPEDACHHDALLAIQTGSDIDAPDRFRFSGSGYHLRTRAEMRTAFSEYSKQVWTPGITNTLKIAKMCQADIPAWESRTWHIPKAIGVEDATATLLAAVRAGLRARGLQNKPEYVERVRHELREFRRVPGMADFLLITAEANAFARSKGIGVGPGRGSVCGSLVCYLIGIHKIDSVRYKLLFERFLNPERPKMPDIDTDFEPDRRHEMFDWARDRFGKENVMLVSAYGTMKLKRAFQSIARAHGIEFQERMRISKEIIEDEEGNAIVPQQVVDAYPGLVEQLNRLEGTKASISRHPAGLLIFDRNDPVRKLIPEMWIASSKQMVSQFDLDTVTAIGLLKQDFLGLRNIAVIAECVRLVQQRQGIALDPDSWVPDEEKGDDVVYKMLKAGKVAGIFQMEGPSNAKGIRQVKPTCFEDIVSTTSLYRKGPIMAGAPARFLQNKKDKEVRVAHPSLEPYLNVSWGEMIYQEQMFEILFNLAGFSWSEVDDAKTAMTKKDAEKMAVVMKKAVIGFRRNGMDQESAKEVADMIQSQAAYLFNRSHAVAYSFLSYQTARLKFLYPLEFMTALLRTLDTSSADGKDKQTAYLAECTAYGFRLLPPDINLSEARFTPEGDMALRWGLQDVKGVGDKAVVKILNGRAMRKKFRRVVQVQIDSNNAGVVKALTKAGAFESIGVDTLPEEQEEVCGWQFYDPIEQFREEWSDRIVRPKGSGSKTMICGDLLKVEHKKTKKGDDYASWTVRWTPAETWRVTVWSSASQHHRLAAGSVVVCAGNWNDEFGNLSIGDPDNICVLLSK